MGYYLEAFICKTADFELLSNAFDKALKVEVGQGLSLIPMTEELFDQINSFSPSNAIDRFQYLTEEVESRILSAIGSKHFSYVEAEYHGGQGGQIGIIWKEGRRQQLLAYGQDRINQVLRYFGIVANVGQDEFSTCGFGLHRHTSEWVGGDNPQ